jgi:hypothetical protein
MAKAFPDLFAKAAVASLSAVAMVTMFRFSHAFLLTSLWAFPRQFPDWLTVGRAHLASLLVWVPIHTGWMLLPRPNRVLCDWWRRALARPVLLWAGFMSAVLIVAISYPYYGALLYSLATLPDVVLGFLVMFIWGRLVEGLFGVPVSAAGTFLLWESGHQWTATDSFIIYLTGIPGLSLWILVYLHLLFKPKGNGHSSA